MFAMLNKPIFIILACGLFICAVFYMHNHNKTSFAGLEGLMSNSSNHPESMNQLTGTDQVVLSPAVTDATTTIPDKVSSITSSTSLLPSDSNSAWSEINPQIGGGVNEPTFLPTNLLIGQLSSTKKNASYDLRQSPQVARDDSKIPWGVSSIDEDTNDGDLFKMC